METILVQYCFITCVALIGKCFTINDRWIIFPFLICIQLLFNLNIDLYCIYWKILLTFQIKLTYVAKNIKWILMPPNVTSYSETFIDQKIKFFLIRKWISCGMLYTFVNIFNYILSEFGCQCIRLQYNVLFSIDILPY